MLMLMVMIMVTLVMNKPLPQQDLSYKYNKIINEATIAAKIKIKVEAIIAKKLHYVSSITILSLFPNYSEVSINKSQLHKNKIGLSSILPNI